MTIQLRDLVTLKYFLWTGPDERVSDTLMLWMCRNNTAREAGSPPDSVDKQGGSVGRSVHDTSSFCDLRAS